MCLSISKADRVFLLGDVIKGSRPNFATANLGAPGLYAHAILRPEYGQVDWERQPLLWVRAGIGVSGPSRDDRAEGVTSIQSFLR